MYSTKQLYCAAVFLAILSLCHGVEFMKSINNCTDDGGVEGLCKATCNCDQVGATQGTCRTNRVCCTEGVTNGIFGFPCLNEHRDPGKCKDAEDCNSDSKTQGTCETGKICCVKTSCMTRVDNSCEDENGNEGKCREASKCDDKFAEQGQCDSGKVCCIRCAHECNIEGVGKACESSGGDGICSPKCDFGTFFGGPSGYCKAGLMCCVIDYRPATGMYCKKGHFGKNGVCMKPEFCEDMNMGDSNNLCFEGGHCCTKKPDLDEKCDCGNGVEGTCVHYTDKCSHAAIHTCAHGLKCCSD